MAQGEIEAFYYQLIFNGRNYRQTALSPDTSVKSVGDRGIPILGLVQSEDARNLIRHIIPEWYLNDEVTVGTMVRHANYNIGYARKHGCKASFEGMYATYGTKQTDTLFDAFLGFENRGIMYKLGRKGDLLGFIDDAAEQIELTKGLLVLRIGVGILDDLASSDTLKAFPWLRGGPAASLDETQEVGFDVITGEPGDKRWKIAAHPGTGYIPGEIPDWEENPVVQYGMQVLNQMSEPWHLLNEPSHVDLNHRGGMMFSVAPHLLAPSLLSYLAISRLCRYGISEA